MNLSTQKTNDRSRRVGDPSAPRARSTMLPVSRLTARTASASPRNDCRPGAPRRSDCRAKREPREPDRARRAPGRRAPVRGQHRERSSLTNRRRPVSSKRAIRPLARPIGYDTEASASVRPRPFTVEVGVASSAPEPRPETGTGQRQPDSSAVRLTMFASRRARSFTEWLCLKLLRGRGGVGR
jgi:hypothetical protein